MSTNLKRLADGYKEEMSRARRRCRRIVGVTVDMIARGPEKSEQATLQFVCNGIHYSVISGYGYCDCKEIEGLHNQFAA